MSRRSVLYTVVIASLLATLMFPAAGVVESAAASSPRRVVAVTPVVPTTTTLPARRPDVVIPPVEGGLAPVLTRIKTNEPVVFLGIDDGFEKQPFELQMMRDNHVRA